MNLHAETLAATDAPRTPDAPALPVRAEDVLADLFHDARSRGASKIHFEPRDAEVAVRYRVAGGLVEARRLPHGLAAELVERIAGAERGGAIPKVSAAVLPTDEGLRAVFHLDSPVQGVQRLESLGMRGSMARALGRVFDRGAGLVVVAGPQGAGVRTTIAAMAAHLDTGARCILPAEAGAGSIGDRVRSLIDQDVDAILIGEIHDRETAAAAMSAAESGRLVIASMRVADAVSAILRLRALRIDSFQLASTLGAVVAQRTVRRLCAHCREPVQAHGSVSSLLGFDPGAVVFAPVGCDRCEGSGFRGTTGVFEAICPDAPLRRLINDGGDGSIIARHAFLNAPNLGSSARALVRDGLITADEAVRVSRS